MFFQKKKELKLEQPTKRWKVYDEFMGLQADLVVVIAYGKIIPENYLKNSNLIFLNVHASLLPKWRGAAPIERAILNKDIETGISIMKIEKTLDTGPFIKQIKVKIDKDTNSGELIKKLSVVGAKALLESIELVSSGKAIFIKQNEKDATYAKKLTKLKQELIGKKILKTLLQRLTLLIPNLVHGLFNGERINF